MGTMNDLYIMFLVANLMPFNVKIINFLDYTFVTLKCFEKLINNHGKHILSALTQMLENLIMRLKL